MCTLLTHKTLNTCKLHTVSNKQVNDNMTDNTNKNNVKLLSKTTIYEHKILGYKSQNVCKYFSKVYLHTLIIQIISLMKSYPMKSCISPVLLSQSGATLLKQFDQVIVGASLITTLRALSTQSSQPTFMLPATNAFFFNCTIKNAGKLRELTEMTERCLI